MVRMRVTVSFRVRVRVLGSAKLHQHLGIGQCVCFLHVLWTGAGE